MKNMRLRSGNTKEGGFTLLELIAVFAIVGILSAVAVMTFGDKQRLAIESTVQSDLATNVPLVLTGGEKVFKDTEAFVHTLSPSNQNSVGVKTTGTFDNGNYCIFVSHKFMTNTYYRHYSSQDGDFVDGECPEGENEAIIPPLNQKPPIEDTNEKPPILDGTAPDAEFEVNGPYTEGNITYTPRYTFNTFGTTGSATIQIEITSNGANLEEWDYVAEMKKAPYFNATFADIQSDDGQGIMTVSNGKMNIKAINVWNGVSKDRSVTVTYNLTRYNPPVASSMYDVIVEKVAGGNQWHACIAVKVTGRNDMPVRWEHFIDISQYFASLQGKAVTYQNLKQTGGNPATPYFVKVEGNNTNNNLVSSTHHANNSQTICYNPGGQTPYA